MHHGCTIKSIDMPKLSDIRITDKTVKNAKPKSIAYDIRDATLRGFILKVQPTGSKAFYAEWARGKRSRYRSRRSETAFQLLESSLIQNMKPGR
jgi:hypothetical protein